MIDGDGNIHVCVTKNNQGKLYRKISVRLCGDSSNPRVMKTFQMLKDHYGFGFFKFDKEPRKLITWEITGKQAISLLNVIKKHLIIKGQHAERSIKVWERLKDRPASSKTIARWRKISRNNTGPLKYKRGVSVAWLAGYIDSDGHINIDRKRIEFKSHPRDIAAYELLQTTYGRTYKFGKNNKGFPFITLTLLLSKEHWSFLKRVGPKLLRHLKIKKWSLEQIIHKVSQEIKSARKD